MKIINAPASLATGAFVLFLGLIGCTDYVAAPYSPPALAIQTSIPSVELLGGDHVAIPVRITRSGFSGPVTLDVAGLPAFASFEVSPNPVIGDSAGLAIRVDGSVAPGTYPLILSASGVGATTAGTALELRVLSSGASTVTVPWCAAIAPTWVAFQDGDGAWTRATGIPDGGRILFRHEFATTRGAIATVSATLNEVSTVVRVLYGSPAELASVGDTLRLDCEALSSRTWRGHVDGLDASEKAFVSAGALRRSVLSTSPDFEFVGVPTEPQDILATHLTQVAGEASITGFILRRGVDIADGAELPSFDFKSEEEFAPSTAVLSILGSGGSNVTTLTELHTARSSLALPIITGQFAAIQPYYALPTSALQPSDLQQLHLSSTEADGSARTMDVFFREATDRTLTLGASLSAPTLEVDPFAASLRVGARFGMLDDYDQSTSLVFLQSGGGPIVSLSMTTAYVGAGSIGFELAVPDLSTVSGFQEEWALRRGTTLFWTATRTGGTVPLDGAVTPAVGAFRRTASVRGTLNP